MNESQKEIYLVPFLNQQGRKIRPVLIISNNEFNKDSQDIIVCAITSNILREINSIKILNKDLNEGKLFSECCVKVENILKVDKKLLIKKIGKINNNKFEKIKEKIISLF